MLSSQCRHFLLNAKLLFISFLPFSILQPLPLWISLGHYSFAFFHFLFSNLYLVVKLVHYLGIWLCITKLMGLCMHANQLFELKEFCTHALYLLRLNSFWKNNGRNHGSNNLKLWLCLAWRFITCANGKQKAKFMIPGPRTRVKQAAKLAKTITTNLAQIEVIEEEMKAQKATTLEEEREHQKLCQQEWKNEAKQWKE